MKKLIRNLLRSCHACHGTGVQETNDGGTQKCVICKGKGWLK